MTTLTPLFVISLMAFANPPRGSFMAWISRRRALARRAARGGDIGLDPAAEVEPSRWAMMAILWSPMVPLTMIVSPTSQVVPHHLLGDADAGGVDDDGIKRAPLEDLGVARDEVRPAFAEGGVHRRDDPLEVGDLEAFGDDHAARERDRPPAHHREVVDGSADGDPPDVPAGEEDRRDYVVVGRKNDVLAVQWDDRAVVQRFEPDPAGVVVLEVAMTRRSRSSLRRRHRVQVDFHSSSTSISMLVTTISIPKTISGSFPHRGRQTARPLVAAGAAGACLDIPARVVP